VKPTVLLSFSNVKERKKNINKPKNLKKKWLFTPFIAITDLAIIKQHTLEPNPGRTRHRHTHYQLSYNGEIEKRSYYWIYRATAKKVENKLCITKKLWSVYTSYFHQKVRGGSTTILQTWSQIRG
jgi:hypothetical protein